MPFVNDIYYHIYNRGVDKRRVFLDRRDYERFLLGVIIFNSADSVGSLRDFMRLHALQTSDVWNSRHRRSGSGELVKIIAYCLLPNHFHLILQQTEEKGISKFLQKLVMGYTKYFNTKYQRSGVLFQGKTKSKPVMTDEYLIWLSAYININAEIHKVAKVDKYRWSSWHAYKSSKQEGVVETGVVLPHFKSRRAYLNYCRRLIPVWQKRKEELGKML